MSIDTEKEIMQFADWFLHTLFKRCLDECGRKVSVIQFPVFKKFLMHRVKRELEYHRDYLDLAVTLHQAGRQITEDDLDELIAVGRDIDQFLLRDIKFLPVKICFDYEKLTPLRRKRARHQVGLFQQLLATKDGADYHDLVRKSFGNNKERFLNLHNEILEIYAEETFIINCTLTSAMKVDSEAIANRMYCSMLDIGLQTNKEVADAVFGGDGEPVKRSR